MTNFIEHSGWMFEHTTAHDPQLFSSPDAIPSGETMPAAPIGAAHSALQSLWQQSGATSSGHLDPALATSLHALLHPLTGGSAGTPVAPSLTVARNALTVTEGGSVALPISVSPTHSGDVSVTIQGLASYETVTDTLDHKVFSGSSITLSAAEVNSGLSLASSYSGSGHPVNTITLSASDTIDGHTATSASQSIVVTDPPATTSTSSASTSSSNPLTLVVAGDNMHGTDAQIEVFVDGKQVGGTYTITADHGQGQTQTIQIAGNFSATTAHQVQIQFINDNWDGQTGDGNDINAYVELISLNGQTIAGIQGTNTANNGVLPAANANEAVMDVDGSLTFNVPATTISASSTTSGASTSSSNPLTLVVAGDNMQGTDAQIEVFVDGKQIGGTYTITADHGQGQTQTIQIAGNFSATTAHQVQIQFINDNWDGQTGDGNDINAYVELISLNGQTITGVHGTNTANNGAVPAANANEAVMDVNGSLTFNVAADPPATTISASSTTSSTSTSSSNPLTLVVAGDNMQGTDAQIEVFVDGTQVGGTYTITADHSQGQTQTIQIAGNFNPTVTHQVQVQFINDAWDGQTGDGNDINVYVELISLNGHTVTGIHGTNTANNGAVPAANANEAVMDVDGSLTFNVAAPSNPLTLKVTGDNLKGTDAQIEVFVDGKQVGGTYTVTADHAQGQTQTIQIPGTFSATAAHQVQIRFINDAWDGQAGDGNDINVYVESISLNGQTIAGVTGTNTANNGFVPVANANEAVMSVDGSLTFNVAAVTPAATAASSTGEGSSTSTSTGSSGSGSSGSSTGSSSGSTGSSSGSGLVGTSSPAGETNAVGIGAGAVPSGPGFYVSPTGNDNNAGTLASPFATLARAQEAMENGSIKTTYVEGGTYNLNSTLQLSSADNGETWQYYPANGVDSAVLDGGDSVSAGIVANGVSNLTINGLTVQHFQTFGILVQSGSNSCVVENCNVGFTTDASGATTAGILIGGATNTIVANNYVHDTYGQGISVEAYYAGQSVNGDVVTGNVVLRAAQVLSDNGAIYTDMDQTGDAGGHVTISNNFIGDYGAPGVAAVEGIYLDDNSSNVTVTGNIIAPPTEGAVGSGNDNNTTAIEVHNGNDNHISDNIIDQADWAAWRLSTSARMAGRSPEWPATSSPTTSSFPPSPAPNRPPRAASTASRSSRMAVNRHPTSRSKTTSTTTTLAAKWT